MTDEETRVYVAAMLGLVKRDKFMRASGSWGSILAPVWVVGKEDVTDIIEKLAGEDILYAEKIKGEWVFKKGDIEP